MCHKIDSPDLNQKSEWSIKGLVVDLPTFFLVLSIRGGPQASIAAIFRQSAGYVFSFLGQILQRLCEEFQKSESN